jgi:putative oxidoreductase
MIQEGLTGIAAWGITLLRVTVGVVFLVHGSQKLFVMGVPGVAAFFGELGIPAPLLAAGVVSAVEFLAGLALILGLGTRWVAIPLACIMVVAIVTVHGSQGFFLPRGYEFVMTLLAANVALALLGSGAAALDDLFASRRS